MQNQFCPLWCKVMNDANAMLRIKVLVRQKYSSDEIDEILAQGPAIFNAGYWGGVKQGVIPKYFATFSWGMKTFNHLLMR